jgi:hypothetical protein
MDAKCQMPIKDDILPELIQATHDPLYSPFPLLPPVQNDYLLVHQSKETHLISMIRTAPAGTVTCKLFS